MTKDRGSRSGRKCVRRAVTRGRPTVPWRVLPRASRCVNRCSTTEEPPKLWMHLWVKKLGVSGKDRLYREVTTLVEILYQGGTYDQLNVGAVASLEIASRRLIAIVEATSKGLDSSNWETARHYTGTSTIFDLAPHELRAYVTRTTKDEAEIDSMRTRGRYVGRAAEAVAVGGLPRLDDMATAGVK